MSRVKLIFGTYNTIPSGETELLFESAYQEAFKPLLTTIYNHPYISPTLFYSGTLLEWLDDRHPEFHAVLGELMANKTIEILGGGYWEPILPLIPASDRVGQIEVMTTYLRKKFGKRSRGNWISGQVWETPLASSLRTSGMDYTFLSEEAFPNFPSFNRSVPVIAEDQGKSIVVFPIMDSITDRFLKDSPEKILEYIQALVPDDAREVVVSLFLNGLSLGGNGTNALCYNEKWIERFFQAVGNSQEWLECIHPGRYLRSTRISRKNVYFLGSQYDFLMKWIGTKKIAGTQSSEALPIQKSSSREPSGTSYRAFLSKYRESALLYAKMMHIEVLTNQLRGDKYRKRTAKEELWRGQENCSYWHGPSGGIYNSRLRHYTYGALLEAEKITRERGIFKSALIAMDFDMDGEKEYLYSGSIFNAYIHTIGGTLFELDYLPISRNYMATFSRYEENYHTKEMQEQQYDRFPRHAFLDHILDPNVGIEDFERTMHRNCTVFPGIRYAPLEIVRDRPRLLLSARGPINNDNEGLQITKNYRFRRNSIEVNYTLKNLLTRTVQFPWGVEINLALSEKESQRKFYLNDQISTQSPVSDRGNDANIESWSILDEEHDVIIHFTLSEKANLWRFPVHVDYRTHHEWHRDYQSSFFMPRWVTTIMPLGSQNFRIVLRINRVKKQG